MDLCYIVLAEDFGHLRPGKSGRRGKTFLKELPHLCTTQGHMVLRVVGTGLIGGHAVAEFAVKGMVKK